MFGTVRTNLVLILVVGCVQVNCNKLCRMPAPPGLLLHQGLFKAANIPLESGWRPPHPKLNPKTRDFFSSQEHHIKFEEEVQQEAHWEGHIVQKIYHWLEKKIHINFFRTI